MLGMLSSTCLTCRTDLHAADQPGRLTTPDNHRCLVSRGKLPSWSYEDQERPARSRRARGPGGSIGRAAALRPVPAAARQAWTESVVLWLGLWPGSGLALVAHPEALGQPALLMMPALRLAVIGGHGTYENLPLPAFRHSAATR